MRLPLIQAIVLAGFLAGCGGESAIKPAEVLDQTTGMTVGSLQDPLEFVENDENALVVNGKRTSFAYVGPIEWDSMGEISYGLWIHVAPGNDQQVDDIHGRGTVSLLLDGGPVTLTLMDPPKLGSSPYKPVVPWGQTAYFALDVGLLKRIAASGKMALALGAGGNSRVQFLPTQDTHATLMRFAGARGITVD